MNGKKTLNASKLLQLPIPLSNDIPTKLFAKERTKEEENNVGKNHSTIVNYRTRGRKKGTKSNKLWVEKNLCLQFQSSDDANELQGIFKLKYIPWSSQS